MSSSLNYTPPWVRWMAGIGLLLFASGILYGLIILRNVQFTPTLTAEEQKISDQIDYLETHDGSSKLLAQLQDQFDKMREEDALENQEPPPFQ